MFFISGVRYSDGYCIYFALHASFYINYTKAIWITNYSGVEGCIWHSDATHYSDQEDNFSWQVKFCFLDESYLKMHYSDPSNEIGYWKRLALIIIGKWPRQNSSKSKLSSKDCASRYFKPDSSIILKFTWNCLNYETQQILYLVACLWSFVCYIYVPNTP